MRFEYIKATSSENVMHFADQAHELAMFNLKKSLKTDDSEIKQANSTLEKEMYPMAHNLNSLSVGHNTVGSTVVNQVNVNNSALINMVNRQTRFSYNDYMKTLNDKLSLTAPNTSKMAGTGF